MIAQPVPFIAEDEYLRRETASDDKSEYLAGTIYAMAGATEAHNTIALKLAAVAVELPLAEVYEQVTLPAVSPLRIIRESVST